MANILDIRRRIRSVKNTRQITKAMKMVSAAKLRRAQQRALAARPFARMLTNILQSLVARAELYDPETGEPKHPLLAQRAEQSVLLIVVTGDKGLAGAFNANILKGAARFLQVNAGKNIDIESIGRKGRDYLKRRYLYAREGSQERSGAVQITGEQVGIMGKIEFQQARELAERVIERYSNQEIDAVYLIYNEFKSVMAQRLVVDKLLPIEKIGESSIQSAQEPSLQERKRAAEAAASAGVSARPADTRLIDEKAAQFGMQPVDYIYEQPPAQIFRTLLPKYVAINIYRAMQESVAAEHAARMTAMDSASNNASEMIDSLTLTMNRARQASITKEIIEIVSGAAAS